MKSVQLDEDIDARHIVRVCQLEGFVQAIRFPRSLRNRSIKDPEVLDTLLPLGFLLVTTDRALVEDHLNHVPAWHAGILIIEQDDDVVATMTTHIAQSILARFKAECPNWHVLPWDNSVIHISPSAVAVFHVADGVLHRDGYLIRTQDGWQDQLRCLLAENAALSSPPTM